MSTDRERPFAKMHGLANDYVVMCPGGASEPDLPELARQVCDRRLGVGADGLLWVSISDARPNADLRMRIFNRDGSEAEMCGNGLRCAVRFAIREQLATPGRLRVKTGAGVLECEGDGGERVSADLGCARSPVAGLTPGADRRLVCVDMGNPHAVLFLGLDDLSAVDLPKLAAEIVTPENFPEGVNLEVVEVSSRTYVRQRTFERGVGETPACGTGAAAVALAARHEGLVDQALTVELTGGPLQIELIASADGLHVLQTGPAVFVFDGRLPGLPLA